MMDIADMFHATRNDVILNVLRVQGKSNLPCNRICSGNIIVKYRIEIPNERVAKQIHLRVMLARLIHRFNCYVACLVNHVGIVGFMKVAVRCYSQLCMAIQ